MPKSNQTTIDRVRSGTSTTAVEHKKKKQKARTKKDRPTGSARTTLRAYTASGQKVFLPFDLLKFNAVMLAAEKTGFGNAVLEQALSAATSNEDESGRRHSYLKIEWLDRHAENFKQFVSADGSAIDATAPSRR